MYSAIEYNDSDVSRYRNYRNWASLSYNEIRTLVVLCLTSSPDEFDNQVFFNCDALCGNMGNRFYKISQVSHHLLAAESIVIAGRRCQVKKIMTYKMSWMYKNYINPIQRVASRFNTNTSQSSSSCVIS